MFKRILLLLLPCLFFSVQSFANVSIDVTYRALDTFKFEVTFAYIRDCRGVAYSMGNVAKVRCMSSNATIDLSPTRTAIIEVSQSRLSMCNPANTYGTGNGFERHIYKDTVDFNSTQYMSLKQCCELRFEINGSSRNPSISTGIYGNYYNYAMLNLCHTNNNNSPQFSKLYFSNTQKSATQLSFHVNNTIDDDSVSYHQVNPMSAYGTELSYSGVYSKHKPVKPYYGSFPNNYVLPNYDPPIGLFFDSNTGDMIFTPDDIDVTIIAIEVREYRKDTNNQYQHIGTIRRDQMIIIGGHPNLFPKVKGEGNKTVYNVCADQTLCCKVLGTDQKIPAFNVLGDTVDLVWDQTINDASFTILNPDSNDKVAEFCWTPTNEDARTRPYYFSATAKDRVDYFGFATRSFSITVNPIPETLISVDSIGCGSYIVASNPDTSKFKSPLYQWDVLYQNEKVNTTDTNYFISNFSSTSTNAVDTIKFKQAGTYVIRHRFRNLPTNCSNFYYDTIIVPQSFAIHADLDNQTLCINEQREIKTFISNSNGQVGYHWMLNNSNLGNASSEQFLFDQQDFEYFIQVLASDGQCADQEVITINTYPNIHPNLPETLKSCDSAVTLNLPKSYVEMLWNNAETDSSVTFDQSTLAVVKVTDEYNCVVYDTTDVKIYKTADITISDTVLCTDVLVLDAGDFASYYWNTSQSSDTIHVKQSGSYSVDVKDVNGCQKSKSVSVTIKPIPTLDLPFSVDMCCNDEVFDLNQYLRPNDPKQGTWLHRERPNSITNGMLNPKFACGYSSYISYYYKDTDPGCVYHDSFEIAIHPNPELALNSGAYCQADLEFNLANDLIATTIPAINTLEWNCVDCNGNDFNTMLDVRSSANTDQYLLIGESYYGVGGDETDIVKLSVTNTNNDGCSTTDTTQLQISKTPPTPTINSKGQWLYTSTGSSYWYFNGNLLYGDERDSILADFVGDFTTRNINDAGCASNFSQVVKKTVGIAEFDINNLVFYPNPTNGRFTIEAKTNVENEDWKIAIYDQQGKAISYNQSIEGNSIFIESSVSSGIYFLELRTNDYTIKRKLVIAR